MIPPLGTKEFNEYIYGIVNGEVRHEYYNKTVEHHEAMEIHVEGKSPDKLLEINRPNEPEEVKKYRLKVYKPVTKSLSDKVVNTFARILNPRLYRIEFKDPPPQVREGEDIHEYLTEDYPFYLSLMQYIGEVGLKKMFSDPNGVLVIWPTNLEEVQPNDYVTPIPFYYESCKVADFHEDKYYTFVEGDTVTIIDQLFKRVYSVEKQNNEFKITLVEEYQHSIGTPPCFRIGGIVKGSQLPFWYQSFISGVLPHWDKVVTMTSDLDGSIVNHLYPERWEWQVECDNSECRGGYIEKEIHIGPDKGKMSKYECPRCTGTGRITSRSPFGALTINRDALNPDSPIPTPPADYITKDIEPIRELKATITEEEHKGFSAINMEILNKVGENQSGIAKTIDRQDLDSTLMRVSNHLFKYFIPNIIYYTMVWRYKNILQPARLIEYIPTIHAPKDFSILSINELMLEYKEASQTKVSPFYLRRVEEEIVNSKFSNNEEERLKNLAIIRLNPFPNKSTEDLFTDLANGAIRKEDWIKANYIEFLVTAAIKENPDFLGLDLIEKDQVINDLIAQKYSNIQPPTVNAEPATVSEEG